jgi:glycosyltransferase involved in cell wall biosynthesis
LPCWRPDARLRLGHRVDKPSGVGDGTRVSRYVPARSRSGQLRILAILNGSVRGFSGGDLHLVEVINRWSTRHSVELRLPRGSSPEIIGLLDPGIRRRAQASRRRTPSRLRYLFLVTARTVTATWWVLRRRQQWDVVVAASHFAFDAVPVMAAGGSAARAVYWWHHATAQTGRPMWTTVLVRLSELLTVRCFRWCGVTVLTANSATAEWLLNEGLASGQIASTVGGLSIRDSDVSDEEALGRDPSLKNLLGRKIVLFFARVTNLKGARELPRIVRAVTSFSDDVVVVVCGQEGVEAAPIHQELHDLERAGTVRFLGFTVDPIKTWLFNRAHVFIAPSYEEGWGITLADGLAGGCWVVAYDLAAVREAFPEGPTFVPLGDVESLTNVTIDCLKRERPSRPDFARRFSWPEIANADLDAILNHRQIV